MRKKPKAEVERRVKKAPVAAARAVPGPLPGAALGRPAAARAVARASSPTRPFCSWTSPSRPRRTAPSPRACGAQAPAREVKRTTRLRHPPTRSKLCPWATGRGHARGQIVQLDRRACCNDRPRMCSSFVHRLTADEFSEGSLAQRYRGQRCVRSARPPCMDGKDLLLGIRREHQEPSKARSAAACSSSNRFDRPLLSPVWSERSIRSRAPAIRLSAPTRASSRSEPHKILWMDAASGKALTAPH